MASVSAAPRGSRFETGRARRGASEVLVSSSVVVIAAVLRWRRWHRRRASVGVAGEGEEHVVERRAAQAEVDDRDLLARRAGAPLRPALPTPSCDRDGHLAGRTVDARSSRSRRRASSSRGAIEVVGIGDGHVEHVAREPLLELESGCRSRSRVRGRSTTTSPASWSASSRYCVVSRTVAPSFTSSRR